MSPENQPDAVQAECNKCHHLKEDCRCPDMQADEVGSSTELRPCPFCGELPKFITDENRKVPSIF